MLQLPPKLVTLMRLQAFRVLVVLPFQVEVEIFEDIEAKNQRSGIYEMTNDQIGIFVNNKAIYSCHNVCQQNFFGSKCTSCLETSIVQHRMGHLLAIVRFS